MRSKYQTNVEPHLKEIEAWARDGVPEEQIAKNLHIAWSTFKVYKSKYSALSTLLARTKTYVDLVEMVGAYKRRAEGYTTTEKKRVYAFAPDPETGEVKRVLVQEIEQEKHVPGDPRAMEFWLRHRQQELWGDTVVESDDNGAGVALIPEREPLDEPKD